MPADSPASTLVPVPAVGRDFTARRPVRLGDVDIRSRLRFDAIARYLQDVATDDAVGSGLPNSAGWVVRRSMVDVAEPALLDETLELTTFCSGTGRSWAERRTSIVGDRGARIEAVSLWVQIDPSAGRPVPLDEAFFGIYGEAAGGRNVSSRLQLPKPSPDAEPRPWMVRRIDLDPYHHANNAAQWAVLEEVVPFSTDGRVGTAEVEFLGPVDDETPVELLLDSSDGDGTTVWILAGRRVLTAARWRSRVA